MLGPLSYFLSPLGRRVTPADGGYPYQLLATLASGLKPPPIIKGMCNVFDRVDVA